ncbi:hypothetical protein EDC04DRAFT_931111 [Pisolithus marmoratus]|nr:hypothetical protein EDC04DRAFT_931111 [Pisolithus marmoratus]
MSATVQNTTGLPSTPLPPHLEPDEAWKERLKQRIQDNLRHMFEDARKRTREELEKAPSNEVERIRAAGEAAIQDIYKMAQEHYTMELQRERQERRLAAGEWTDDMMKEQKVMWDNIERGKWHKATGQDPEHTSFPPKLHPPQRPPPPHGHPATKAQSPEAPSSRKAGGLARAPSLPMENERSRSASFSHPHSREFDDVLPTVDEIHPLWSAKPRAGSITPASLYKAPSIFDGERPFLDRLRPSPMYDDEPVLRPDRSSTDPPDFDRRESIRRKPIIVERPNIPEIWKPSITPEEDAQMSRTFNFARRGSTTRTTSSLRAPTVSNAQVTDEPQAMSSDVDREKAGTHMAEQEWGNLNRARDEEKLSHTHSESRPVLGAPQRLEERSGMHQPSSNIPNPYSSPANPMYSRPFDSSSRVHISPPSASRPFVSKKSVSSLDDVGYGYSASPGSKGWSRSPYGGRNESPSRSPQTPDENPRNWQPSSLRAQIFSQDMHNAYFQQGQLPTGGRTVPTHYEEDFEGLSDDEDVAWHHRGYHEYNLGQIKEIEDLRVREEAARKWEENLKRREEQLEREKETRKIEEAKQKEEARQDDEIGRKKEEDTKKATLAKRKEEEAEVKKERAIWIEEAKRKEREVGKKELEIKRKEEDARRKESEIKRKEEDTRRKELEVKRKEEGVKRAAEEAMKKEGEARRRERQASLKEAEARRVEEVAQMKQAEALRKEAELRQWEAKVRRREEEVLRKEAELMRFKGKEKQRMQ